MPKAKSDWTIHGLWPANAQGKQPSFCNGSVQYNAKLMGIFLRSKMKTKWPTLKLGLSNDDFWQHEWYKHGTCALNTNSTNSLPKYFSKSLKLLHKYNIGKILAKSGITPDNTYKFDDIIHAIDRALGVKVKVRCAINSVSIWI
jgi:ribonuclease T2